MTQKKPLSEAQVNALLSSLEAQRNNAMNGLAEASANLSLLQTRVLELEKLVKELSEPKADTVAA